MVSNQTTHTNNINTNEQANKPIAQGTVNVTTLNIRAGARTDRPIITKLSKGTKVTILGTLGDWYKIKLANGTIGWCVSTYIS